MPERGLHDPQVPGPLAEPRRERVPQAVHGDRPLDPGRLEQRSEPVMRLAAPTTGQSHVHSIAVEVGLPAA
jgi:hypothetical protein